jgi:hypothetical protein
MTQLRRLSLSVWMFTASVASFQVCRPSSRATSRQISTTTALQNSLKPAAMPLMDSGKALARTGELLIEVTTALDLYGGALSAVGAEMRNGGDAVAQAAASCRFKTGMELVTDELRESGTCLQEGSRKLQLAIQEAQQDELPMLALTIEKMMDPMRVAGEALEAAGAGIMQRAPVAQAGKKLEEAGAQLATISSLLPSLHESAELAGQRLAFAAERMTLAGQELQGVQAKPKGGKSWLKGGL